MEVISMKQVRNTTMALISLLLLALVAKGVYADDERYVEVTDVNTSDGLKIEVVEELKVNDILFTDRNYTITEIPEKYLSLPWIRTSNNSKNSPNVEISFKIDREANIYLVWDPGTPESDWVKAGYTLTGDTINTSDALKKVYKSNNPFPPGEVKTYEANAPAGFYTIIVEATGKAIKRLGRLTQTWANLKAQ